MNLTALVEGYELLCSTSQLDPNYLDTGRTVLLHDDGLVRIYLTKGQDSWEDITLEIEVFMGVRRSQKSFDSELTDDVSLSRTQLIECISHIDYLLRLEEAGFNLEIVLDGCIWTARFQLKSRPSDQLFEIIVPPYHLVEGADES